MWKNNLKIIQFAREGRLITQFPKEHIVPTTVDSQITCLFIPPPQISNYEM